MVHCSVLGCKSRSERTKEGISFHGFPMNPVYKNKWIIATGRINWMPTKNSKMCSLHFDSAVITKKKKLTMLKNDSVPIKDVHENTELSTVVVKIEYDDEEAVTTEELGAGHSHAREDYAPDMCSFVKEEKEIVMKTEDETDEVIVKQELDIGPTVLQPQIMPRALPSLSPLPSHRIGSMVLQPKLMLPSQKTSITENEKHMVSNVYKYVQETWPADENPHKRSLYEKTARILGINVASVYGIFEECPNNVPVKTPVAAKETLNYSEKIDNFGMSRVRKKVLSFYMKGELPTVQKVLQAIDEDEQLPDFKRSTFLKLIKHLKFKHIKIQKSYALMDSKDIVIWRRNYLNKIREYRRQNRRIFYVGETWVDSGITLPKTWMDAGKKSQRQVFMKGLSMGGWWHPRNSHSKGKRLIIMHIGNEDGFVEGAGDVFESNFKGDRHDYVNAERFEKWFEDNLPKLGEDAVVVMDDAPHHSRRQEEIPTRAWKKVHIQKWLRSKQIRFDEEEVTTELLKKIKDTKTKFKNYSVDELAKRYNAEVLRLPTHHC